MLKYSHIHNTNKPFVVGCICVFVFNPLLSLLGYAWASQSILAPLASLSVVWNIFLAPRILHESVRTLDYVATGFLCLGCVLVSVGGSHDAPDYSKEQIDSFFSKLAFLIYIGLVLAIIFFLAYFIVSFPEGEPVHWYGHQMHSTTAHKARRFSFGAVSGLIGGLQFFGKAGVEVVSNTSRWYSTWEGYVYMASAGCVAVGGVFLLNMGLKRYDAVAVVSIYESLLVLNGSVSGLIFFDEIHDISSIGGFVLYFAGLCSCMIGIGLLGLRGPPAEALDAENRQDLEALLCDGGEDHGSGRLSAASSTTSPPSSWFRSAAGLAQARRVSEADVQRLSDANSGVLTTRASAPSGMVIAHSFPFMSLSLSAAPLSPRGSSSCEGRPGGVVSSTAFPVLSGAPLPPTPPSPPGPSPSSTPRLASSINHDVMVV